MHFSLGLCYILRYETIEPRPIKVIQKTAVGIYTCVTTCLPPPQTGTYIARYDQAHCSSKPEKSLAQDVLTGKYVVLGLLPYDKVPHALKQPECGGSFVQILGPGQTFHPSPFPAPSLLLGATFSGLVIFCSSRYKRRIIIFS